MKHIDTLALPDQLSSVLTNRLLQHVLCLQPSHSIVDRISYWLGQELMDLWYWSATSDVSRARLANILSKVVQVTKMIKVLKKSAFRWTSFGSLSPTLTFRNSSYYNRICFQSLKTFLSHLSECGTALTIRRRFLLS